MKSTASTFSDQPRHELLQVADIVAREKGIERDEVLVAMELAIQKAAKAKYGLDLDINVEISRGTGDITLERLRRVVEVEENPAIEISLEKAKTFDPNVSLDDVIGEKLPPVDFGRVAAQSARQVIFQKVRDAERAHQFEEFKDRCGEIISGLVKRVEFGNTILDLGRGEGVLRREDTIPRETFRVGDRIRVLITELRPDAKGPMILLSRTHPRFMAKLFEQEVPEIYDGIIEIQSVARDPGSRAKLAVSCNDPSLDPIGACVGMRGSRVQAVVNELQGEKVDIILWSQNPATFIVNALAPAEVLRVVIDEDTQRVDVVVAEDQLSLAIGRRGQNVRLASQLTGWNIDIIAENEDINRRAEENSARVNLFLTALDVDEMVAQLLASEGFTSVEDVIYIALEDLAAIDGFDEEIAAELKNRAELYLERRHEAVINACREKGMEEALLSLEGLNTVILEKLLSRDFKTRDDLAELSGDELRDLVGTGIITEEEANAIIMTARAHWF